MQAPEVLESASVADVKNVSKDSVEEALVQASEEPVEVITDLDAQDLVRPVSENESVQREIPELSPVAAGLLQVAPNTAFASVKTIPRRRTRPEDWLLFAVILISFMVGGITKFYGSASEPLSTHLDLPDNKPVVEFMAWALKFINDRFKENRQDQALWGGLVNSTSFGCYGLRLEKIATLKTYGGPQISRGSDPDVRIKIGFWGLKMTTLLGCVNGTDGKPFHLDCGPIKHIFTVTLTGFKQPKYLAVWQESPKVHVKSVENPEIGLVKCKGIGPAAPKITQEEEMRQHFDKYVKFFLSPKGPFFHVWWEMPTRVL